MARVKGRTDDLLIVKGARVFPAEIEALLREFQGSEPRFQVQVDRVAGADVVTVLVEVSERTFFDEMRRQRQLEDAMASRLAAELGVAVGVNLVGKQTLERSGGTVPKVMDRRKIE
jgi:phenylacetate-CoA ligase